MSSMWGKDDGLYRLVPDYSSGRERHDRFRITMQDGSIISESYMDVQRIMVSPDGTLLTMHLRGRLQEPITFVGRNLEKLQEELDTHEVKHVFCPAEGQQVAKPENNPPVVTEIREGV